jgi:hypothetical protein
MDNIVLQRGSSLLLFNQDILIRYIQKRAPIDKLVVRQFWKSLIAEMARHASSPSPGWEWDNVKSALEKMVGVVKKCPKVSFVLHTADRQNRAERDNVSLDDVLEMLLEESLKEVAEGVSKKTLGLVKDILAERGLWLVQLLGSEH